MDKIRAHHVSFRHAWDGIKWAINTQPNFRVHLSLSAVSLILCWIFSVSMIEYLIIIFTILLGLTCEMLNTSIEAMTDLITTKHHLDAKIAKDVSAGMMLVVAIGAVLIASLIFGPKALARIGSF
ncbi:MAG: diacylglycerol kinase family protein [Patescibacteria group bacterium]